MILLLDIGNTRIKWGFLEAGVFQSGGAVLRGEGDVAAVFTAVQSTQLTPTRVVVSNVAGSHCSDQIGRQMKSVWGCEVALVETQAAAFGVTNGYAEPQQLGVDRWLALVAARNMTSGALCVVDCGTALTVDVLNSDGVHLGGMIVPGLAVMQAALVNNTEGLSVVSEQRVNNETLFLGRTTADGIAGGARYALTALIERVVTDAQLRFGSPAGLVLSGGDAKTLSNHLQCEHQLEPDLVLKGLAVVAGANAE